MDSGLVVQYWIEMIGCGLAFGFVTHLLAREIKVLLLLGAAAVPPIIYLAHDLWGDAPGNWLNAEILPFLIYMLITGMFASLAAAIPGALVACALRRRFGQAE